MLEKAIQIALRAHAGQVDKGGEPYILHPLRVMLSVDGQLQRVCAVLHDVVEDSDVTLSDLKAEGFSDEAVVAIDCLTKRAGEGYDDFIGRVLQNETACRVKLADLKDNMDLKRIAEPTDEDRKRLEKYREAEKRILSALPYFQ